MRDRPIYPIDLHHTVRRLEEQVSQLAWQLELLQQDLLALVERVRRLEQERRPY